MLPMLKQQVTGNAMQCSRESRKHHVGWLCFFAYSMTKQKYTAVDSKTEHYGHHRSWKQTGNM